MSLFRPAQSPGALAFRWAVGIALAILVGCGLIVWAVIALSRPVGAEDRGAWFKSLRQPATGLSCCDISDCKRTEARWEGNGWVAVVRGVDRSIPGERVLQSPRSLDGDAYVCASEGGKAETATIYCFIPPDIGS